MESKKTVLSCIQPTAEIHIGNYFGAIQNWVNLQDEHKCVFGIVDLHAMTVPYRPQDLRDNTAAMATDLVACGIDPERATLFVQSQVPQHTELCWILACLTSASDLGRMTQFKDKGKELEASKGGQAVSAGLFIYPVLQAADILLYRADYVPVGKDQEQHLELSRKLARRFNRDVREHFPEVKCPPFPEPRTLLTETPKVMSLVAPTKKMSKSAGSRHYIGLFEDPTSIRAKVQAAVTDSGESASDDHPSPGISNLLEILRASGEADLASSMSEDLKSGGLKYSALKTEVADALIRLTAPIQERKRELAATHPHGFDLDMMSQPARVIAAETLEFARAFRGI